MILIMLIGMFVVWAVVELVCWLIGLIFCIAAVSLVWVVKVWVCVCLLGFLVDIFTSYKGNTDWY